MKERKDMIAELDLLTRQILFIKEGGRCYIPGCTRPASDCAHLIGRAALAVRWDTEPDGNCHMLCRECHSKDHAGQLSPSYVESFIEISGQDAWERLTERARAGSRIATPVLEVMLQEMRLLTEVL